MIPKKIHYCWFGYGEKPKLVQKCIGSWKTYCPDYELIEWNETNVDIKMNAYVQWCYENRKYAFLSDYIRLLIVEKHGGIYFDTDVEVIKKMDDLLYNEAFFGFETENFVNTGLGFGAEQHNPVVKQMLKEYEYLLDGKRGVIGCPHLNTDALEKFGITRDGTYQKLTYATVFPIEYFNPFDVATGKLNINTNTYAIHWYAGSWMSKRQKVRSHLTKPLHRIFGKKFF